MHNDLLYQLALTHVPNIGSIQSKILIEHFGNAEAIFRAKKKELASIECMGEVKASCIKKFDDFDKLEEEIAFIEKYHIKTLFITDTCYPQRLLNCYDAPSLLFYRGNADLNVSKIISIIGTRNNTDYGKQVTEQLVAELKDQQVLVVSGLAFGIDAIAHKASLKNDLKTVGVMAHGLDSIYPHQHKSLATEMLLNGGLLTEFNKETKPDKHNFPRRNRIVAGMADATIVIETAIKGGSMITAELANSYNKDVFAFPGRTNDSKSAGCNYLIKSNKACLITEANDVIELLGWQKPKIKSKPQRELFIDLSEDEKIIVEILKEKEGIHIDELYLKSGLSSSAVASAILNLELQNIVLTLPGKMYRLM
ncbi:MAG: DNA-processing protein DprA [Ilyomonas sp.]